MHNFKNDYSDGAHPALLDALIQSNSVHTEGYGVDSFTEEAKELIKKQINREDIDIHFFAGGTQTNLTCISAFLRPYEAVISADSGHINVHETGAIEATGHKVITAMSKDGKLTCQHIESILSSHHGEHMVKPRLVYISNSTEVGTTYNKSELQALRQYCLDHDLYLFMDGARLACALTCPDNDLTLEDLSHLCDAFYIGGTKNGALLGEAVVLCNHVIKGYFRYQMKQKGALLAKGRIISIQFIEFFKDNLYFKNGKKANDKAFELSSSIKALGYDFLYPSNTNQLFPILPDSVIEELQKKYSFYVWTPLKDGTSAIRLITSWSTPEQSIKEFLNDLKKLSLKA